MNYGAGVVSVALVVVMISVSILVGFRFVEKGVDGIMIKVAREMEGTGYEIYTYGGKYRVRSSGGYETLFNES